MHRLTEDCEWHDEPLAPDTTTTGRTCEWRAVCGCGWSGPWHSETTSVAAAKARVDYREHVEETMGVNAYYDAPVACRNCGSEHEQGVLIGTHVTSSACVRCGTVMLNPSNDAWDDSKVSRGLWGL